MLEAMFLIGTLVVIGGAMWFAIHMAKDLGANSEARKELERKIRGHEKASKAKRRVDSLTPDDKRKWLQGWTRK